MCPVCSRMLKPAVIKWSEDEHLREYSTTRYFCPCCGAIWTLMVDDERKED